MVYSKFLSFGSLLALLDGVVAQAAPGFPVNSPSSSLGITYGNNNTVEVAGELLPRSDVLEPPNISTPVWTSRQAGVLLMVDSDVPRNGTRVELLHWLVSNVTNEQNETTLTMPSTAEAPYRAPNPPVGDIPHAYTFMLFAQPENFSIPEQFADVLESRLFFNTSEFVAAAGLGPESVLAANYIRVQNLSSTPTTTFPPPRPTDGTSDNGTASTPMPFPGAAPGGWGNERFFWAGLGTAMLAGVAAFVL